MSIKFDILNKTIDYRDIENMRNFIEYYEDSQQACNEYNKICKELRTKYNIPNETSILEELNKKINKSFIEKLNTKNQKKSAELQQLYEDLTQQYNLLSQFKKIIEINRSFDENSIMKYEDNYRRDNNSNNGHPQKFEKQKSGIRLMYVNIKYLYEVYRILFEYNKQKKGIIQKIKLKKALKRIKPIEFKSEYNFANIEQIEQNIIFFNTYSKTIEQFNEIEGPKIISALKETQQEPTEIKVTENITLITKPQTIQTTFEEEPSYTKTKSA